MKAAAIILILLALIAGGVWLVVSREGPAPEVLPPAPAAPDPRVKTLGHSVEGRALESYTFGTGSTTLAFIGGIHGGYEGNSVALAKQFSEYLKANPGFIPPSLTLVVIPNANPDGFALGTGPEARFNAHQVDLNRNFDCEWQAEAIWRGEKVSAGTAAFSEPEAAALRDFFLSTKPAAVIFWHSQANAVYASRCGDEILPGTKELMNTYATASGYGAVETFDAYPVTGAAEDWLASLSIPAITVELSTHEAVEWEKNLAGIRAVVESFNPMI